MAADGIFVNFPDYQVNTETAAGKQPLGHGMVIAVDPANGQTRGSEYGRYTNDGNIRGKALRVKVPSLKMANPGNPTQEELDTYAKLLDQWYNDPSKNPNRHSGGRTQITYVRDADYNKLVDMMKSAETQQDKGYYQTKPYSILNHNCGTYAADMLKAASPALARLKWKATSIDASPSGWSTFGTPGMSAPKSILMPRAEYDNPNVKNPSLLEHLWKVVTKK